MFATEQNPPPVASDPQFSVFSLGCESKSRHLSQNYLKVALMPAKVEQTIGDMRGYATAAEKVSRPTQMRPDSARRNSVEPRSSGSPPEQPENMTMWSRKSFAPEIVEYIFSVSK